MAEEGRKRLCRFSRDPMLLAFANDARRRWEDLIRPLPEDDTARLRFGRYEVTFDVMGARPLPNLSSLRSALEHAGRICHTGWGPFIDLGWSPYQPRAGGGTIETWLGAPDPTGQRHGRDAAHSDFWVAHPAGKLFLMRGYEEDNMPSLQPGTAFDIALPIWRIAEALLYAARFGSQLDDNPMIAVRCHYFGLSGRDLVRTERHGISPRPGGGRICHDSEAVLEAQATASQINDTLAEVVHPLLTPLYERFGFYQLSMDLVVRVVTRLRESRF